MKKHNENNSHKRKSEKPFLGLPGAVWMTNDLYIKFPNPINSSLDTIMSSSNEGKSTSVMA
jgi:hypothetical protein